MASEKLIFRQVKWSPVVSEKLKKATYPEEGFISGEVVSGISQCWQIDGYGYLVTRFEIEPVKTLVIVAGQGRGLADVLAAVYKIAMRNGAQMIRIHSRRAGMVRVLKKLGYRVEYGLGENVFYKKVA